VDQTLYAKEEGALPHVNAFRIILEIHMWLVVPNVPQMLNVRLGKHAKDSNVSTHALKLGAVLMHSVK
jgi:hypothetical protein